ncbi:MAG: pYEATS domain-containing protein [Bacteroidia bacterium]
MKKNILLLIFFTFIVFAANSQMRFAEKSQDVLFNVQTTSYSNGVTRWDVTVDSNDNQYDSIVAIEYNLDGLLFKNPVRKSVNPKNNFLLTTFHTVESNIEAVVHFKNGDVSKTKVLLSINSQSTLQINNTAKQIKSGLWEWEAFLTGNAQEINNVDYIIYQLHPTFKEPYQKIDKRGDLNKAFALSAKGWGIFILKATVYFKDGKTISLRHVLKFNTIKVDVFYLESTQSTSHTSAEKIAQIISNNSDFKASPRLLTDIINAGEGYRLSENQIRYNILENDYVTTIIKMLSKEGVNSTFKKNLISYDTPEYISIFIVR